LIDNSYRLIAENSADIIMRVNRVSRATYVSRSSFQVLGWKPEELIGQPPDRFVFVDDLPALVSAAERALRGERDGQTDTFRMLHKNGKTIWMETRPRLIRGSFTGEQGDVVIVMRDITDRKNLELELSELALIDSLTGLANRRAFDQALEREWRRTLREGLEMSLLLLDLDHFKRFNDQYGHQVGDDCLRAVAAAILNTVRRPEDIAARYGGEEIAVILPNTQNASAMLIAEKLRSAVEGLRLPHSANPEGGGWVTASVGAATAISRSGGTIVMPQTLLSAADAALYNAKREGRNRVATSLFLAPDESG
jgi:diguanylate cyclase (GGDEF)-like protein/PAS domain S-box-containing protein